MNNRAATCKIAAALQRQVIPFVSEAGANEADENEDNSHNG